MSIIRLNVIVPQLTLPRWSAYTLAIGYLTACKLVCFWGAPLRHALSGLENFQCDTRANSIPCMIIILYIIYYNLMNCKLNKHLKWQAKWHTWYSSTRHTLHKGGAYGQVALSWLYSLCTSVEKEEPLQTSITPSWNLSLLWIHFYLLALSSTQLGVCRLPASFFETS